MFHGLRHTYASQLVQAGTPLPIVARQLGHANTDTVSRTYGHLSCIDIERELERRFAPLTQDMHIDRTRLGSIRRSLQDDAPVLDPGSWPMSNFSQFEGEILETLKGIAN